MALGFKGLFARGRISTVNYNWSEFLEGNGIVLFNGALMPGKTTKYEYLDGTRDDTVTLATAATYTAQTFTIGTLGTDEDFYPTKIWIDAIVDFASITIEIQETTAGEPNGTVVAKMVGGLTQVTFGASEPQWKEYAPHTSGLQPNVKLSAGTMYALVIYRAAGNPTVGFDTAGAYGGGSKWDSPDSGANWTIDTGADLMFRIFGSTKNPYILTTASVTSSVASTALLGRPISDQFTQMEGDGTLSFEGRINKSALIEGDASVNCVLTDTDLDRHYTIIELYHIRGAVETKIGEAETWLDASTTGVEMELTRTPVASGDFIKLLFKPYYINNIYESGGKLVIGHSGTNLKLFMPFKTDL